MVLMRDFIELLMFHFWRILKYCGKFFLDSLVIVIQKFFD